VFFTSVENIYNYLEKLYKPDFHFDAAYNQYKKAVKNSQTFSSVAGNLFLIWIYTETNNPIKNF
jgi:20S proteasome alpha/beta subunit